MIKRITLEPYDTYDISTFTIFNGIVEIGHFGGVNDDDGQLLETVEEQTIQTFKNLEKALKQIGLGLDSLLKVTVILKNIDDFKGMHRGWVKSFKDSGYPVRTTITSDFVNDKCLIQIDAVAAES